MSSFIGRKAEIGVGKETVRGTAVTPSFWLPHVALTFDEQVQQAIDESSVGVVEDAIDAAVTEKIAVGELEGIMRAESFGMILLGALGSVVSAVKAGETIVFEHTYSVGQTAQHQSLTVAVKEPNSGKRYANGMVTDLELAVVLNEYARFTAGLRAKVGVTAVLTPAYNTTEQTFLPQHGTFKFAATAAGLDAASAINIRSFNLTIAKNVEDDQVIGSTDPADILNKQFAVEGTLEILYSASTHVDTLLADTAQAMRLDLTHTATIGVSSNPKLRVQLNRVKFSEVTKPFAINDLIVQTISFKGFYSLADAKMISVVLTNTTASY